MDNIRAHSMAKARHVEPYAAVRQTFVAEVAQHVLGITMLLLQ